MPLSPGDLKLNFNLDADVAFLNHGSFGACPKPVFERWQQWQAEMERQPVEFIGRRQEGLLDDARAVLADYVGCGASDLTFVSNTTAAINIIARSVELRPGDEILSTNLEYGALNYTWEYLCNKVGARYVQQPISLPVTTRESIVDQLWQGVTGRTRAIFLSHITSATALILPVEETCARAREEGILTIIDGAHVPGQIPLDIRALNPDINGGNCHKWLCAPKGSAFLYVSKTHQPWVESGIISWGVASGSYVRYPQPDAGHTRC
jgi:isopenicillin-N epimerase